MCGRYATTRSAADLSALFEAFDDTGDGLVPDYNVAPTDPVPMVRIVRSARGGRVLASARWGLVPRWATDTRGAARMINARAETVATSPAFAPSFARRRCLVPADGWYEWVAQPGGGKQAYYMTPRGRRGARLRRPLGGRGATRDQLLTCSVVTTAALGDLAAGARPDAAGAAARAVGGVARRRRRRRPSCWRRRRRSTLAGIEIRPVGAGGRRRAQRRPGAGRARCRRRRTGRTAGGPVELTLF